MAQDGDTITYTYDDDLDGNNDLIPEQEDVSTVDQMTIEYLDGAGGVSYDDGGVSGGAGGRAENVVVNIDAYESIYIWVGASQQQSGRYDGGDAGASNVGGGSTEVWFDNTNQTDSADEPFIVAAGGGGGAGQFSISGFSANYEGGGGGARGGGGGTGETSNGDDGEGVAPPLGGDGGDSNSDSQTEGTDGAGSVNSSLSEVTNNGTTTLGGGSGAGTNGEVQILYESTLSPPDPPSNLSAEVQ